MVPARFGVIKSIWSCQGRADFLMTKITLFSECYHLRLATQLDNLPSPTSQQTLADVLLPTGWPVNVLYPSETGWLMDTKCLPTVV